MAEGTVEELKAQADLLAKQNDRRRVFLDEWRVNQEPYEKRVAGATQYAVAYGQMAIRNIFLLNGGGLIVVPTFAQLAKVQIGDAITLFLLGIGFYVAGLVLITVSALLAYYNFRHIVKFSEHMAGFHAENLNRFQRGEARVTEADDPKRTERDGLDRKINKTAAWSVGVGVAAGVCFVAGTVFSMLVLAGVR